MVEQNVQRRLAAIFAADMVGYSRLMEADERGTIARHKAHRAELIDPKITEYHGRIVKLMGDGMLVEFVSVVDAVQCAVVIQEAMGEREADQPPDQSIRYRIGVNVGDIVIDGDDILGDGVNVAARLEGLAEPGGIAISANAYEQTQGKLAISFVDAGVHEVKNLTRPVRVWRWQNSDSMEESKQRAAEAYGKVDSSLESLIESFKQPTVAILPFTNMSSKEDLEFFCDGLTESLITDLSRGTALSVAARNSSFLFKGQALDIAQAAGKLEVRYLVEGSVQSMSGRMRVNAQLIDSATGDHLWADRYDRSTEDLFAAQDELCDTISVEIDVAIAGGETARLGQQGTDNDEARMLAQRSIVNLYRYNQIGLTKGQQLADEALAIDPNFIGAQGMASMSRVIRVMNGWAVDAPATLNEALELAGLLIGNNPDIGIGYTARGYVRLAMREFDEAVTDCMRGVKLAPSGPAPRHIYARTLLAVGRFDEAFREIRYSLGLQSKMYSFYLISLGLACLMTNRTDDAMLVLKKFQKDAPNSINAHAFLAAALVAKNQYVAAEAVIMDVLRIDPSLKINDVLRPYPFRDPEPKVKLEALLSRAGLPK